MKTAFIRLCLDEKTPAMFKNVSGTEMMIFIEMIRTMHNKNFMTWTAEHKKHFCQDNCICLNEIGNVSASSFSNFLRSLCRKNLIWKLGRNKYEVNPFIIKTF